MADRIDELYALAPGEFTAARDALAKELRAAGDRDAAGEVKALRKPSVAAWAINRAARERKPELEELLGAARTLRRAHERLLSGKGDRAVLREATEHERAAVGAFARAVAEVADAAGAPLSDAVLLRVRETLHAAALDQALGEQVAAGRLERETEAVGAEGLLATATVPQRKSGGQAPRPVKQAGSGRSKASGPSAAERRAARGAHDAAVKELRAADRAAGRAEREADAARRRSERAAQAVQAARERLEAAEAELADAQAQEEQARSSCRRAKEALAAAQAAADEAERAAEE